jgi:hypothetical protein
MCDLHKMTYYLHLESQCSTRSAFIQRLPVLVGHPTDKQVTGPKKLSVC